MHSQFERIVSARAAIEPLVDPHALPPIGIVLGSGLGPLQESIKDLRSRPYSEIPGLPKTSVVGHDGAILTGTLGGARVVCLSGRAHLYEGHEPQDVVFGVRLLASLNVQAVILTNAAGGIADNFTPGTLMLLEDHLNLTGKNPLIGSNDDRFGPRFPDMSEVYSKSLREIARQVASALDLPLASGVYAGLLGPSYETPAEVRMLRGLGASAVGMSTVLEAIALTHQKVPLLGISCITNLAAGLAKHQLSHEEVSEVAGRASANFCALVEGFCRRLAGS